MTVLIVAGCIAYSLWAAPVAAPQVQAGNWISDQAQVLSQETEETLRSYNQSFDSGYGSIIAVVTTPSTRGWEMADYAMDAAEQWALSPNDLILVLDIGGQDAYFLEGGNWPGLDCSGMLDQYAAEPFFAGDYDTAVLQLFAGMDQWYESNATTTGGGMVTGGTQYDPEASSGQEMGFGLGSLVLNLVLVLLVLYVILAAVERSRYQTWYGRYGHMAVPPVLFVPIFPWHRPGSPWFIRMGRRPPRPPRGPGGPRGPHGPGGFGGGFGGFGGFGGSGRGGGFGGGHGGGFGGGHGGGFGGGGFGGGHGGGFGGGRGGGFGH